jgi:Tfp pilus assembly protein PilZ
MTRERRSFEREPTIIAIEPQGNLLGKMYRLRDISKGGFRLETDHCMTEGENFDFSFRLPDRKDSLKLCGKVVWVKKISSFPERYHIGFAFPDSLDKLPELFYLSLTDQEKVSLG